MSEDYDPIFEPDGIELIVRERNRQKTDEGVTGENDSEQRLTELVRAGALIAAEIDRLLEGSK